MNEIRSSVVPKLFSDSAILRPRAARNQERVASYDIQPHSVNARLIASTQWSEKSHFCFAAGCFGADVFEAVPIFRAGVFLAGALTGFGKPVKSIVVIFTGS